MALTFAVTLWQLMLSLYGGSWTPIHLNMETKELCFTEGTRTDCYDRATGTWQKNLTAEDVVQKFGWVAAE